MPLVAPMSLLHWGSPTWPHAAAGGQEGPPSYSGRPRVLRTRVCRAHRLHPRPHLSGLRASQRPAPQQRRSSLQGRFAPAPITLLTWSLSFLICAAGKPTASTHNGGFRGFRELVHRRCLAHGRCSTDPDPCPFGCASHPTPRRPPARLGFPARRLCPAPRSLRPRRGRTGPPGRARRARRALQLGAVCARPAGAQ